MDNLKKFLSFTFLRFLLVGVFNTLISTIVIFFNYNIFNMGYWKSTFIGYIVGGCFSFIVNRSFTFRSKENTGKALIKFIVTLLSCYFISYSIAQPIVYFLLAKTNMALSQAIKEQLAILAGMVIYTFLNYFIQKVFVFRESQKA